MGIKHSILICMSIFIVFLIATISIVSADETYVYLGDSIQSAINDAASGDTIIVYPGIYSENIDVNKSVIIKSKSGNPDDTIIRAANSSDHVFNVTANNVAINGFTITGAFEKLAGVSVNNSDYGIISNNLFLENGRGVLLKSASNNILENNTAINNDVAIRI